MDSVLLNGNPVQCRKWLLLAVLTDKAESRRSQLGPLVDLLKEFPLPAGLETHMSSSGIHSP